MSQGLLLFDASERLVAHNQQHPDMRPAESYVWGTDLVRRELIKSALNAFPFGAERDEWPTFLIHDRKGGEI